MDVFVAPSSTPLENFHDQSHEPVLANHFERDSGVAAIESLISRRGTFDYIILETSGLADPGNLVPLFWVDDGLGSTIYLDGIVTLIDAKNILLSLEETPISNADDEHEGVHMTTAHLQISHADVLVINKSDSVTAEHLATVKDRVRAINGLAKMHITQYGQIPELEGYLLDLHAYDGIDDLDTTTTTTIAPAAHSHIDPVGLPISHTLTHILNFQKKTISTLTLALPPLSPTHLRLLTFWLQSLLWDTKLPLPSQTPPTSPAPNFSIHRLKGRIITTTSDTNSDIRTVITGTKMLQGVREVFEIVDLDGAETQEKNEKKKEKEEEGGSEPAQQQQQQQQQGKIVLIGRGLVGLPVEDSLRFALGGGVSAG